MNNRLTVNMIILTEHSSAADKGLSQKQLDMLAEKQNNGEKIVLYTPLSAMLLEEKGNLMLPDWDATLCQEGQIVCNEHDVVIAPLNLEQESRMERCVRRLQKYWNRTIEIHPMVI